LELRGPLRHGALRPGRARELRIPDQRRPDDGVRRLADRGAAARPRAEQRGLVAALRGDPAAANHFFMAREGMVPRETFFNPENLQRVMAGAA
jgi:hypothetical protein